MLFLLAISVSVQSKDYDHEVQGTVVDNITGEGLAAKIFLMNADGAIIDTTTAVVEDYPTEMGGPRGFYTFKNLTKKGRYTVKAELEGYNDSFMDFELRSNREGTIFVKRIYMNGRYTIPEVTIKATKVKMVMKGDTIVYNADAFNLAEGSMLDALVARLPGVKLTKDGQIFVNGKYVENLLVNGHDFFSGNPKLALESLPSYTVSKIKVYDKAGHASKLMGRDMGDRTYMMDVNLKKEYAVGYMGKVEAGLGSNERYNLRGFGMKFSDKERLGGYFNFNNLNDNQRARLDGEWSPQDMPDGLLTSKMAGVSYLHFLNGVDSWIQSEVNWEHINADNEEISSTQTYLPGGDSFHRLNSKMLNSRDSWSLHNMLILQPQEYFSVNTIDLSYTHTHGWGSSNSTIADSKSELNRMLSESSFESSDFNFAFGSNNGMKLIADMMRGNFSINYNRNKQEKFSANDVQYLQEPKPRDFRNNYSDMPDQDLKISAGVGYDLIFRKTTLRPEYNFTYNYNKAENMLYRLDKLADRDENDRFDLLPSAIETLADVLDARNSYRFSEYRNEHRLSLYYNILKNNILGCEIVSEIPFRWVNSKLYYDRAGRYDVTRQKMFFEPNISLTKHDCWSLRMGMKSDFPVMTELVDYTDNSNPLNIRLGNSNLKNIHRYYADGDLSFHGKHQQAVNFRMGYHQTDNQVAYGLVFDKTSGTSTIRPISVNGNWNITGGIGFTRAFGKSDRLTFDNQFSARYSHSVDMATVEGYTESQRSIVNNTQIGDELRLLWQISEEYELTLHGGANYYHIDSRREGFTAISAGDYNIGFKAVLNLPLKIQMSTDMTMFARRGYQQFEMNTTDWVWNAQFTRPFLKGRILAKLQGFDILHQLSSTRYIVNEQGRTESWNNSIPRYVMLSLSWRFNVNPKRKNEVPCS